MEQLYEGFVEKEINEAMEAQIIRKNPEFSLLLKEYYEGILLFDIMEKEVWKKASEDSTGQHQFFDTHVDKYAAGERAVSVIYSSGNVDLLLQLKKQIEQQDTIAIKASVNNKSIRQESGTFQQGDRPALAKVNWQPGVYESENNGIYYLVHIKEIIPPGVMTFEEARVQVISDYQDYLEKSWLVQLRKKYPVKINEKAKKQTFQQLKP
jgi:peptidyl-prolyl cis-trans isomerase SurA